ncbi:hypothetical protein M409DRAFT_58998 [Zasmidium cellare ATCC 36951]|uniref:Pentacotripeptide-repeat region of PRORP domain-containing protein n=1 Tax=Zasmidium cellare ATCC 36951 TaxID=1080233 RepID=A0A6A6C793_ZASCE|nr:uncharacterized protein M409DRAFT_58998 [Zasmidium cellare ATCC 36951]KAF2161609.1 hypothetical protein M409DRAFT_58998 [Zasmidium cellare ATCC 36951]
MPLCRLAIRSLLHSRSSLPKSSPTAPSQWPRAVQSYSTALEEGRRDESPPLPELDLSKVTAESSYLDFILGPKDGELPTTAPDARGQAGPGKEVKQRKPTAHQSSPRRQRLSKVPVRALQPEQPVKKDIRLIKSARTNGQSAPSRWTARKPTAREMQRIMCRRSANTNVYFARAHGRYFRTKHVTVRSGGILSGGFSSTWNTQFARIQRYYDRGQGEYMSSRLAPMLHGDAAKWAREAIADPEDGVPMMLGRLAGFTSHKRYYYWSQIALWLMYNEPEYMIKFLQETHTWPYPPVSCIDDSLRYLAMHFSHQKDAEQLQALSELFPLLADREKGGRLHIDGSFFRLLMPHCSHEQINEMYRAVKVHHVKVDWNTYLHFSTHFARSGHFEQALDALLEAKNADAALDSYAFRSNCATLLRNSIRQPAGLRVCMRIVDNLVKIGVTLNNQLCNIVMLNAVEAGDLKTAFSIYSSLVEHGLEADSYTYAILLKGCKSSIDDADTLNATIRDAIQHVNVTGQPVVATEILHCLAIHHKKHNPERAYEILVEAFGQLFDTNPLQQLGLLPSRAPGPESASQGTMPPSQQSMAIMMAMFLDHDFSRSRSAAHPYEVHRQFRALVDLNAEPFTSMIETDHISNCFLMTFIKTKKGLLYAAEVIKDMQREPPDSKAKQCKPTQQSWSIFLHGFSRHGLMKLAEQVLNYMRNKGIEPNEVTWNTLATGYASAQDMEGLLDVLRRMELDSVTWDEWTMNGLRKFQDQDRLRQEFERRRKVPQLDFTSDIKDSLGERLNTFGDDARRIEQRREDAAQGAADSPSDLAESGAQSYTPFN